MEVDGQELTSPDSFVLGEPLFQGAMWIPPEVLRQASSRLLPHQAQPTTALAIYTAGMLLTIATIRVD